MAGQELGQKSSQSVLVRSAMVALILVLFSLPLSPALGADDDDDEPAVTSTTVDKAKRRLYVGGRDEEELTVQASLPQPVRSPDAVPGANTEDAAHD